MSVASIDDVQGDSGAWPRALAGLALTLLVLVVGQWEAWRSMARVWATTTTYHHGFLVLPIALGLVWLRRDALRLARPRQELAALPLLAGFALLALLGTASDLQLVQHVAAVGLVVAATVALLGREVCRPLWFPLLFLFFMVPAGDEIVPLLQDLVARFSVALLRWLDIPVFHDGLLITIPAGVFVVAEACAGIRFLIANVMVTALFAYLALDRPWKWVLFLGIGITVPIVANMIRAFGIILIAHLTDGAYAVGVDHLIYGWGFFTAIMLVILWIGSRMADRPIGAFPTPAPLRRPAGPWRASVAAIVLAVGLAPAVYANTVMRPPAAPEPVELASLQVGEGWRRTVAEGWQPHIVGADGLRVERFVGEVGAVDVARAYFAFERQGAEMVHHGHRFVSEAWNRVDGGRIRITTATGPLEARFRVFRVGLESRIVLWWYALDGRLTADPLDLKLAQASQRLRGAFPPAAIVLLSTRFYEDMDAALARLLAFVAAAGKLTPVPAGNV